MNKIDAALAPILVFAIAFIVFHAWLGSLPI